MYNFFSLLGTVQETEGNKTCERIQSEKKDINSM